MFENLRRLFLTKKITVENLNRAVTLGWITSEQEKDILDEYDVLHGNQSEEAIEGEVISEKEGDEV